MIHEKQQNKGKEKKSKGEKTEAKQITSKRPKRNKTIKKKSNVTSLAGN
jgi:hypothetical protein